MPAELVPGAVEVGAIGEGLSLGLGARVAASPTDFWARDLALRAVLATPADTAWGLYLRSTLETLRALGDEALARRCLEVCGPGPLVEFFRYPVRLQLQMMSVALETLAARQGCGARGLRYLGLRSVRDSLASHAGRVVLKLGGGEGKRFLDEVPMSFRMGLSYGKHTLRWTGPASVHWAMERDFMPYPFLEGVLQALLESTGARNVQVVGRQTGTLDSEYDVCWE
ncbi:TIGR02265 family protein [Archangium gephyra]|uniref:TIGR02265 family protein n=1 Tax=Archangium gephyra TaxID=48 RepID=UPI003B7C967C